MSGHIDGEQQKSTTWNTVKKRNGQGVGSVSQQEDRVAGSAGAADVRQKGAGVPLSRITTAGSTNDVVMKFAIFFS